MGRAQQQKQQLACLSNLSSGHNNGVNSLRRGATIVFPARLKSHISVSHGALVTNLAEGPLGILLLLPLNSSAPAEYLAGDPAVNSVHLPPPPPPAAAALVPFTASIVVVVATKTQTQKKKTRTILQHAIALSNLSDRRLIPI
uniref:Uncharacterized protein n=1 Tax=Oryza nivara TaxID=4536 RepID=A0A0E0HGJ5_ORYNI